MKAAIRNRQRLHRVDTRALRRLTLDALRALDASSDSISVAIVDDAEMARLNLQFHATDGPTDVLTFRYDDGDPTGEIVISIEHAVKHARRYRVSAGRELALYVAHGLLHLHGHDDLQPAQRSRMRQAERALLRGLAVRHDFDALLPA
jgi:probable rRNA maturation factor